jgi:chemotaxis protein methyltransferase CheR
MFRDPEFFRALKSQVFPNLQTYPYRKIWHAGCSTGEEVYSLSILLKESGMLDSSIIYATDINTKALSQAKEAIYPLKLMQDYTRNYIRSGGEASFSEYYTAHYDEAILSSTIKKNIVFSLHNLVNDGSFNEFNMIVCRNVLIYFNKELQDRVFGLFHDSLSPLGYLALGSRESLLFSKYQSYYKVVDKVNKIYRKIN